jgi:hypothetical protein
VTTFTEMAKGQIATDAGGDKLRGELLNAKGLRCGNAWMAVATTYSDGAAEIEVSADYDAGAGAWRQHEYYYSFEAAIKALAAYEQGGTLPAEDDL